MWPEERSALGEAFDHASLQALPGRITLRLIEVGHEAEPTPQRPGLIVHDLTKERKP